MRDGARTTYFCWYSHCTYDSYTDSTHDTVSHTHTHTHTPTTRSMSLRVFGICAQLASQRRRLSKRRVAMALEAVEAYLSEHHCKVSWHIALNNHASTRPKQYGGATGPRRDCMQELHARGTRLSTGAEMLFGLTQQLCAQRRPPPPDRGLWQHER